MCKGGTHVGFHQEELGGTPKTQNKRPMFLAPMGVKRVKVTLRALLALLALHVHQGVIHDRHVLEERLLLAPR